MNCIAIDTTDTHLSIALIKDGEVYSCCKEIGKSGHSSALMPAVDRILKDHGTDIADIDTVAVVVGPGSFTGIRIGVSAMTAIACALNAKRISVTTFELIAYNREKILAGVDAGHGNLYVAECEGGKVVSTHFIEASCDRCPEGIVFDTVESKDKTLAKVVMQKSLNKEYVHLFEPFYMRKSQAERENEI